ATHQQLDLNAVYRPFTKDTITLDGTNTAATVRRAWRTAMQPRFGPVHIAMPSDIARQEDRQTEDPAQIRIAPEPAPPPDRAAGFEPVESDKLWHHTMKLVSIGPLTIAAGDFHPRLELVGDVVESLTAIADTAPGPYQWSGDECAGFLAELERTLRPAAPPAH